MHIFGLYQTDRTYNDMPDDEFSLTFINPLLLPNLNSSLKADLFQNTPVYTFDNVSHIFSRVPHDVLDIRIELRFNINISYLIA